MKCLILTIFFAAFSALAQDSSDELKPYESNINDAKINRLDKSEAYLGKLSEEFTTLKDRFQKESLENQKMRLQLKELLDRQDNKSNQEIEKLKKQVADLEAKIAGLDVQQMKKDLDESRANFEKLSKDYAQAKSMLEQIKLLIQADYSNRFSSTDSGNNKLKGIVEEINKIQLPKPTPTPTPTPTATATATPSATETPNTSTPVSATPTPAVEENFIEKYPLPARQAFCRKPENLKKFQKECLPYL